MVKHCFRWWLYPDQELNSAKIEKLPSFQVFQEFQVFLVFAKIMKFGRIQQELWNSAGIVQFSQNCETHRPPCQPTFTPPCRPPFQPPCPSPCQPPRQPPFASTLHQLCNILVWSGRIWIHYRQYAKTVSGQGRLGQLKNLLQVTGVMIIWNLNLVISHFELSLIWPASRRATLRIKYKTKASGSPLSQVEITFKSLSWRCWSHPSVDKEDFDSGLVGGRGGHHCQKWRGSAAQSAQQTTAHLLNRTTWILLGRGKELSDRYKTDQQQNVSEKFIS